MYISPKLAYKHLNLDESFEDDRQYVIQLINAAESMVATHLNCKLEDILEDGELPPQITQAILLLVGTLYANRESVAPISLVEVPLAYQYLLSTTINYNKPF